MKTSDFYFDLPEELIAQEPLADRASSRLMVVHKDSGRREHRHFRDIKEYLRAGDCLVINNTKVLPARLYGERVGTGAARFFCWCERIWIHGRFWCARGKRHAPVTGFPLAAAS